MASTTSSDFSVKPRVLIADDSRIVRATLIKHIQGMFEFREALDGEEAWETLLIDPNIRVVITDLTMPKLDGYGLLARIRGSKISRIRNIPVVVVSGSDELEERVRAKEAGATDLITKGIGTAQLLSRLDILSKLVNTQFEFERSLEALVENATPSSAVALSSRETLDSEAEILLTHAVHRGKNFVILNVCIGLRHEVHEGETAAPPLGVVNAVGQLLQRTIRQTDRVAETGDAEFTVVTGSINSDAARHFAQRVCRAIASAHLVKDSQMSFVASCGLVSLSKFDSGAEIPELAAMRDTAHRRALLGLSRGITGVVGAEEAVALLQNKAVSFSQSIDLGAALEDASLLMQPQELDGVADDPDVNLAQPDLATFLQWIKEGKQDTVLRHLGKLPIEMRPLVELMLQQSRR